MSDPVDLDAERRRRTPITDFVHLDSGIALPSYLLDAGPADLDGKPLSPMLLYLGYCMKADYAIDDILRAFRRYENSRNGTPPTAA